MESNLSLKSMGKHNLEIFTAKDFDPGKVMHGYEIDSEHIEEDVERPINPVDENKYVCLIDTDEECEWEFFPVTKDDVSQPFLINITAEDTPQQGVSSEFERLVLANLPSSESSESNNARVEPVSSRISEFEEWILRDDKSFYPVIIGPDYIDCWKNRIGRSGHCYQITGLMKIRPLNNDFEVPDEFIEARKNLFVFFKDSFGGRWKWLQHQF